MTPSSANATTARYQLAIYAVVFIATVSTVAATSYLPGQEKLLRKLTVESGLFEIASAMVVLLLAIYAAMMVLTRPWSQQIRGRYRQLCIGMMVAAFLVAGEELSWGQHLFGFSSPGIFTDYNAQSETNLHNFVPGHYLSGFLNTSVYIFFIYLPCLYRLRPDLFDRLPAITATVAPLLPSFHVTLMMVFSSSLHPYFLATSTSDTLGHLGGLVFVLILLCCKDELRTREYIVHWGAIVAATLFFMLNTHVFRFYNMQAEIREFIVILAGTIWFVEWTQQMLQGNRRK